MKKIVILGGGFAGVESAIALQKSGMFDVTLVSDRDYLYIYPISIWIPTRGISPDKVKLPLVDVHKKHRFKLIVDPLKRISTSDKTVYLEHCELNYDYLIIAIGAEKVHHEGMENTLSICGKPEMSLEIRQVMDKLIAKGSGKIAIGFGGNLKDKSAVRGGPAFEFAFNIHHYLKKKKIRDKFTVSMFAPMDKPGARLGEKALVMMDKMFDRAGIKKYFGKKIKRFETESIVFEYDMHLNADLTMFIPASKGHSLLLNSGLSLNDAGFVKINDYCEVENTPDVYAIGDTAEITGYDWVAKQGHLAELMGLNVAFNIIQKEKGSELRKGYFEHLNVLCIMDTGNGAAIIFRNHKKAVVIPLPIVGHWLKQAWGVFTKISKRGII